MPATINEPTQLTCVLTRIEAKSIWYVPLIWWHYRTVNRSLHRVKGLIRSDFLFASSRTVVLSSIWDRPRSMEAAARDASHVHAAQTARRLAKSIWSTQWHLTRLSPSAREWPVGWEGWVSLAKDSKADHRIPAQLTVCTGAAVRAQVEVDPDD